MTPLRYLAIINPAAKGGNAAFVGADVVKRLSALDITSVETSCPGDGLFLTAQSQDYDVVIAIGGDGTVHEVANGLMRIAEQNRPALSIIPCGSGNDSCRMAGIPLDIEAATQVLTANNQHWFDLGVCNETYFTNSFSAGLDARTVAKTIDLKQKTGRSGMVLYGQALIDTIFHDMHPSIIDIDTGDGVHRREVLLCAITNGQTYGAGFRINPTARPDDGTLTLSHIDWMSRMRVLGCIPRLLRATHVEIPEYRVSEIVSCTLTAEDDQPLIAQMDGEILKERTYRIEVRPRSLRLVV